MDYKKILKNYLETISAIADQEYQEIVWVRGEGPEYDNYTESMHRFFDLGNQIIPNYKDYDFSENQIYVLVKLSNDLEHFNGNVRFTMGPDFLHSSEWNEITVAAKEVLRAFGIAENIKSMTAIINKTEILNNHLQTISGISDREYQERVWIRAEGPECDDYTESMCHFFDDGDPIISDYKYYNISERQVLILVNFRETVERFNSKIIYGLGPDFIDSPEWHKVTMMAKEVLRVFNYPK